MVHQHANVLGMAAITGRGANVRAGDVFAHQGGVEGWLGGWGGVLLEDLVRGREAPNDRSEATRAHCAIFP